MYQDKKKSRAIKKEYAKAREMFGLVGGCCPHCNMSGYMDESGLSIVGLKIFNIKIHNHEERVEVNNINGLCSNCSGAFRISNGILIKRAHSKIEIPSISIFYTCILSFIGVAILFGIYAYIKSGLNTIAGEYIVLSVVIAIFCSIITFIFLRMKPLILLKKPNPHENKHIFHYIPNEVTNSISLRDLSHFRSDN